MLILSTPDESQISGQYFIFNAKKHNLICGVYTSS
jgi:hypothetical protein